MGQGRVEQDYNESKDNCCNVFDRLGILARPHDSLRKSLNASVDPSRGVLDFGLFALCGHICTAQVSSLHEGRV